MYFFFSLLLIQTCKTSVLKLMIYGDNWWLVVDNDDYNHDGNDGDDDENDDDNSIEKTNY